MAFLVQLLWALLDINSAGSKNIICQTVHGCEVDWKQPGGVIQAQIMTSEMNCLRECSQHDWCTGANIGPNAENPNTVDIHVGYSYYQKAPIWSPCLNGGTFFENNCKCLCAFNYTGQFCHRHFYDCSEATDAGLRVPSDRAVMLIQPKTSPHPFAVSCLLNWGGYTHIEMRSYGPNDFGMNRTWDELKFTIGEPAGNHWLGLEYIHQLTAQATYDLDMMISDPLEGHPLYRNFKLSDEASGYRFSFDTYNGGHSKPSEDGFAFGSRNQVNGQAFATFDRPDQGRCAVSEGVAWWYSTPCPSVNLHKPLYDPANYVVKHATWVRDGSVSDVQVVVFQVKKRP